MLAILLILLLIILLTTDSLKFKTKITGQTNDDGEISGIEIMVPLKYLRNFRRTLEMSLNNCEVELIMTWSADCVIISTNVANQNPTFTITETDLSVSVVTLSTQDNAKLLPQLKSTLKRTISQKYLAKPELLPQNPNINRLIEASFEVVNRLSILAFEYDAQRISKKRYYLPNEEIKDYNIMIDGKNFFDQPIKKGKVTYENIRKIARGQWDDCTTGRLLDYIYFKNY